MRSGSSTRATAWPGDLVVERIRNRWSWLFPFAVWLTERLKKLAGGEREPSASPRGLIFRLPRLLALRLIGADPRVFVEDAISYSEEALDALVRREDLTVVCRLPSATASAHLLVQPEYRRRYDLYKEAIADHCSRRHILHYDRYEALQKEGRTGGIGLDGAHADAKTRTFEGDLVAGLVLAALDRS